MDRSKAELINQLNTMTSYVDEHFEEIAERDAKSAMQLINMAWRMVERRKGERRVS